LSWVLNLAQMYKKLLLVVFFGIISLKVFSSFEGKLLVMKQTAFDSVFLSYHIKGNMVRIEEADHRGGVKKVLLLDLNMNTIHQLDPSRKLYTEIKVSKAKASVSDFEIIKSSFVKKINGFECYQWRVRSKLKNSEVTYWVAKNDMPFLEKMTELLNGIDAGFELYLNLYPGAKGFIPVMVVERTIVRDVKAKSVLIEINNGPLNTSLFKIPTDYKNQII